MFQTLYPYAKTAKTAEIMAKYRPIAPKPEANQENSLNDNNPLPQNIRKSAYLRGVWPQLQARPTRARKRGRTALASSVKRPRSNSLQNFLPSFQGFVHAPVVQNLTPVSTPSSLITPPLLPCNGSVSVLAVNPPKSHEFEMGIDLNRVADDPEELDFIQQLQGPSNSTPPGVITPRAVRPVGSTIFITSINQDPICEDGMNPGLIKRPEDVEKEVESQELPVIVSDSRNRVRLENSAYKELVGQPECCWLDYMAPCEQKGGGGGRRRIGGEVVLQVVECGGPIPANGFTCKVKIEWGSDGMKNCVGAFCEATRLECSKDFALEWRFHIN